MLDEKEWKLQFDKEPASPPEESYEKHVRMLIEYAQLTEEQRKSMNRENVKTFNDVLKKGRTEPTVYGYLQQLEIGNMTQEEALIGMVLTLVEQKREAVDKYIKHMERCTTPRF